VIFQDRRLCLCRPKHQPIQSNGIKRPSSPIEGGVKADNVAVYAAAQMSNTLTSPPSNAFALFAVAETTVNGNGAFAFQGGTINNGGTTLRPNIIRGIAVGRLDIASESASNYLSTAASTSAMPEANTIRIGFLTDGTNNGSSPRHRDQDGGDPGR